MVEREIVEQWNRGIRILHLGHHLAATSAANRHRVLGVPVIILTAATGTSGLIMSQGVMNRGLAVILAVTGMAAAVLASVQTFLNYQSRSEEHRIAAVKYGELRRRLDLFRASMDSEQGSNDTVLEDLRKDWCAADRSAPPLPGRHHRDARRQVEESTRRQGELRAKGLVK
jgi:hypothetical protein